jgi:hypothetical protein
MEGAGLVEEVEEEGVAEVEVEAASRQQAAQCTAYQPEAQGDGC